MNVFSMGIYWNWQNNWHGKCISVGWTNIGPTQNKVYKCPGPGKQCLLKFVFHFRQTLTLNAKFTVKCEKK
jgi:hypothetical protein